MVFNKCPNECCKIVKGPKGDKGPKGLKGKKGEVGDRGPLGPLGPIGDNGPKGDKGDKGDKGLRGAMGEDGDDGPIGDIGLKGIKGDDGPIGDKGPKGPSGPIGDKGPTGDIGPTGDKGITGPPGERGQTGQLGETGELGPIGDKGEVGDRGPRGANGEGGDIGVKGLTGEKGDKGVTGSDGIDGPNGDIGYEGEKSYEIPMPGEIMMKKAIKYILNKELIASVVLNTPVDTDTDGVEIATTKKKLFKMELDCVYISPSEFETVEGNIVVPIGNINSVSAEYTTINERDRDVEELKNLFLKIIRCAKGAPETIMLNSDGEPMETGNLQYDFEYVLDCSCSSASGCQCIAKKIDLCKYESYESNLLSKLIKIRGTIPVEIKRIITKSGDGITGRERSVDFNTGFKIESTCISTVLLSFSYEDRKEGGLTFRCGWTLFNLDKALIVEFNG